MNVEVDALNKERIYRLMLDQIPGNNKKRAKTEKLTNDEIEQIIKKENPEVNLDEIKLDLNKIIETLNVLNRRVKLSVNHDINRIIITVVDKNTNKIVKEIPSAELQNLASHLKKAIGILIDKSA